MVCRFRLVAFGKRERYFGLFAGRKTLALVALLRLQRNPFDIVLFFHRVRYAAHGNGYEIAVFMHYGYVLFFRRVGYARFQPLHFFAATGYGHAAFFYERHDVSAMFANIKFLFHFFLSSLVIFSL